MKNKVHVRRRSLLQAALLAPAAAWLAGCTTPYQPKSATGGFTDRKLGTGHYEVAFVGNGNTSAALVADMFLYRCAELTARDGFDVFRSAEAGSAGADAWSQPMADDADSQDAKPMEFRGAGGGGTRTIYVPSAPVTVTIHRMTGVVRMARYAEVPSTARAWDARIVMQRLEGIVKGNSRTPLSIEEVGRVALVAGRGQATMGGAGTSLDDLRRLLAQPQD